MNVLLLLVTCLVLAPTVQALPVNPYEKPVPIVPEDPLRYSMTHWDENPTQAPQLEFPRGMEKPNTLLYADQAWACGNAYTSNIVYEMCYKDRSGPVDDLTRFRVLWNSYELARENKGYYGLTYRPHPPQYTSVATYPGDPEAVLRIADQLVELAGSTTDPTVEVWACYKAGAIYAASITEPGSARNCLQALEKVPENFRGHYRVLYWQGLALLELGEYEQAFSKFSAYRELGLEPQYREWAEAKQQECLQKHGKKEGAVQ